MKPLVHSSLIDMDLWSRAKWCGVEYILPAEDKPPGVGLIFMNEPAAINIFSGWLDRLGTRDTRQELRLCIVEGEIPGLPSGYSVSIGTNVDVVFDQAKTDGVDPTVATRYRIQRMPNTGTLARMKPLLLGEYSLFPEILTPQGTKPLDHLAIVKRGLIFRTVAEIGSRDLDAVVLGKPISPAN